MLRSVRSARLPVFVAILLASTAWAQDRSRLSLEISARVVDEKGAPIAGAGFLYADRDSITTAQALTQPNGRTDESGRLSVTIPPASEDDNTSRQALLVAPGRVSVLLSMTGRVRGTGESRRKVVDLGTVVLRSGVKIRGLVRSAKGRPVAGARVTAVDVFKSRHLQLPIDPSCSSWATTDEDGKFTLMGIPPRGVSVKISADGFHDHDVQYANQFSPLVAQLTPSGRTTGRVVDAAGKPVGGVGMWAYYESSDATQNVRVDDEGRFEIAVRHPGRYQLGVTTPGGYPGNHHRSDVMKRPTKDVVIRLPEDATSVAKTGVEIRAKTAEGKPVLDFKAVVYWSNDQFWKYNAHYLEIILRQSRQKPDAAGMMLLRGPTGGQPPTGRILLKAPGYAPRLVKDVEWDGEKRVKISLTLEPQSLIEGVVIDEKTEKPMVGARVHVGTTPSAQPNPLAQVMRSQLSGGGVETDEKGRFRIEMLGEGTHHLTVSHPDRPDSKAVRVTLEAGEAKKGIELRSPKGATLVGKLVGAKIGVGWKVKCNRNAESQAIMLPTSQQVISGGPGSKGVTVGPDGKFRIAGLSRATYQLTLMVPYPLGVLEIPIEAVKVRANTSREFDISEGVPARVHGKARVKGAPMTPGRLLVLAQRIDNQHAMRGLTPTRPSLVGPCALVGRDNTFELPARAGKHVIKLVDLATGVTLFQGEKISIKAAANKEFDIDAELAMALVELAPDTEGGAVAANRLEIKVQHPNIAPSAFQGVVFGGGTINFDTGVGVALRLGQRRLTVILPAVETKLLARSSAHQLDPRKSQYNFPLLGQEVVHPAASKTNRFKVIVSEPEVPPDPK